MSTIDRETTTRVAPEDGLTAPRHGPRPETVLLLVVAAAQAIAIIAFGRDSDYWYDDLLHLSEVKAGLGLSWHDLTLPVFGHLVPGFRLVFWLLAHGAPGHYRVALAFEVICAAGATLLLGRVVRLLTGRRLLAAVLAGLYAFSATQISTVMWFSASLHALPSTALTLAAAERFLMWQRDRRPRQLVGMVLCWGGALAFYEKPVLLPLWLLLLTGLVLPEHWTPRRAVGAIWDSRGAWACFAVLGLAWLKVYTDGQYGSTVPSPTLSQYAGFLRVGWFENFWVSVLGATSLGGAPQSGHVLRILGQALFAVLVVVTAVRRPAAWRAWLFFLVAYVVHVGLVAQGRAGWGANLGNSAFYVYETSWLLVIAVAVAVGPARHPGSQPPRPQAWFTRLRWPRSTTTARARSLVALGASALLVLAAARGVGAAHRSFAIYPGRAVHLWAATLQTSLSEARAGSGDVSLYDTLAPTAFTQHDFAQFERLSAVLGTGYADVPIDDARLPGYLALDDGHVVPAHLDQQATSSRRVCTTGEPLPVTLTGTASGPLLFVQMTVQSQGTDTARLRTTAAGRGLEVAGDLDRSYALPRSGRVLVPLRSTAVHQVVLYPAPGDRLCVSSVLVGTPVRS